MKSVGITDRFGEGQPRPGAIPVAVHAPSGSYIEVGNIGGQTREQGAAGGGVFPIDQGDSSSTSPKKAKQWATWQNEIIPVLKPIYKALIQSTCSLSQMDIVRNPEKCYGCSEGRIVTVNCIYFDRITILKLCTCTLISVQLLQRGFFPCAPKLPSLAVDINMLDFMNRLFVNIPPNHSAWSTTLEEHLRYRNYQLDTQNTFRKKFTTALQWYTSLVDEVNLDLKDALDALRPEVFMEMYSEAETESKEDVDMNVPAPFLYILTALLQADTEPDFASMRASDYLRNWCPLCFGDLGNPCAKQDKMLDVVVCLDGNFTQKRCRQNEAHQINNFPRTHPDTVFLSPENLKQMQEEVEQLRPERSKPKVDEETDGYVGNMKVPISILKGCEESFTAADERRVKASTQFFSDTGLMALLCRHDRVLWLANMTSAGERQYYALALIYILFLHLPAHIIVGLLYDVACILHQSCEKWGFLAEFKDRIRWAVSVFHAFGHQWPCQLVYHPRKAVGFGLSDGESCERLWKLLKALIPNLRVAGYFMRLYVLDSQVKRLDAKSLEGLGKWLRRKWSKLAKKTDELKLEQSTIPVEESVLRSEWASQIEQQTKPLPRQKKNAVKSAIEQILDWRNREKLEKEELARLLAIEPDQEDSNSPIDLASDIADARKHIKDLQDRISKKRMSLNINDRADLDKLISDKFLQLKINALALKTRIRNRLRFRKLELEKTIQDYRGSINHQKLQSHTEDQVKKKDPSILALVKKYNGICEALTKMISSGAAPTDSISPKPIDKAGLFQLDVDNEIWHDIGLIDDFEGVASIPRWLADDDVRHGIRLMLELDRCEEERVRLLDERVALRNWMAEEWKVTALFIGQCPDPTMVYLAHLHAKSLVNLCARWQGEIRLLSDNDDNQWGPSMVEIKAAKKEMATAKVRREDPEETLLDMDVDMDAAEENADEDVVEEDWEDDVEEDIEELQWLSDILDGLELGG
ncbi:hypothetical protein C8J56DRAFT_783748 [Mycena floridula]|nr:hypothetical protein C8J56DRAFT_783748 [Mycena floridula]